MGKAILIVSEITFLLAFFFTSSASPVFNVGGGRPPVGIEAIRPWGFLSICIKSTF